MLKRFEVENYRGFADRLVLDLSARDYSFNQSLTYNGIVNKAIIYGKNGVGKSDLGLALFDIVSHLTDKTSLYKDNYRNIENIEKPVKFKYTFKFANDEVVYEYEKMDQYDLRKESLFFNNNKVVDYDYFGSNKYIAKELLGSLNVNLIDNKLSVLKYIFKNTPTNNSDLLTKMMRFCDNMLWYRSLSEGNTYMGFSIGGADLTEVIYQKGKIKEFEVFLSQNGLHYDLNFESENGMHVLYAYFNNGKNKARFTSIASTGTMALLLFFTWESLAFDNITFLFIDEFDAFLHYESSESLVNIINKLSDFQSILTTHNTYLMQNRLTRPDCCFLMTKNKISNLFDATDREIREAHNLEKMYINGAFKE